ISEKGVMFPEEIESDGWIIFHGTSGYNAEQIEQNGFKPYSSNVSVDDIKHVVSIFEKMCWSGKDTGGYTILKSFSLNFDVQNPNGNLFFAEKSIRALLFSTRDFSGGEKLRALRKAIKDLEKYLY